MRQTKDDLSLYWNLIPLLIDFECNHLIFGRDFKFVFNLRLDKQNQWKSAKLTSFNARDECIKLLNNFDLFDMGVGCLIVHY